MKRWLLYPLALLLVCGALYWWVGARNGSAAPAFATAAVERADLESSVTATGKLEAVTRVDVGSEVSGVIQALYVKHNSPVRRGQLLAQINPLTLQAQADQARASLQRSQSAYTNAVAQAGNARAGVKKAQAALMSAQAKVEQARAATANSRAALAGAEANLRKARADRDDARRDDERLQTLRAQDLISQEERDNGRARLLGAEAALDASAASLEGARASLRSAEINIGAVESDTEAARIGIGAAQDQLDAALAQVEGANADVDQSRASLQAAQVNLGRTSIRSPIDGVVLDVLVSEGQTVAAQFQAPSLFVLARNLEEMQVSTTVDEADIGQVRAGALASFTVDAWPDQSFRGRVVEVRQAATTTNNVVTYPVILRTSNPGLRLKPGMTATVSIAVETRRDALAVPNQALRFRPPQAEGSTAQGARPAGRASPGGPDRANGGEPAARQGTVYTLDSSTPGKLVRHRIVRGLSDGTRTEVLESDLQPGDLVITGSGPPQATPTATRRRAMGPF